MKLETKYNLQVRKCVVKKIIASSLAVGLFFNSVSPLFAGVLSEDGRYETFEGNNIKVENILEEDTVDVEIEGNTLMNYSHIKSYIASSTPSYNREPLLKPGNTYTLAVKISDIVNGSFEGTILRIYFTDGSFITPLDITYKEGDFKVAFTIPSDKNIDYYNIGWIRNYVDGQSAKLDNLMILDGDWSDREIPEYFDGIKSVEYQNNTIEITSRNKNLFNTNKLYTQDSAGNHTNADFEVLDDSIFMSKKTSSGNFVGVKIKCKKGQPYTAGFIGGKNSQGTAHTMYIYSDKLWGNSITSITNGSDTDMVYKTFTPTTDELYVGLYMFVGTQIGEIIEYKDVFVYEGVNTEYERYQENSVVLEMKEPLRSLPNGISDKVVKENGQWMIKRNCKEVILDGSSDERWSIRSGSFPSDTTQFFCFDIEDKNAKSNTNIYCDRFISRSGTNLELRDCESIFISANGDGLGIYVRINNSKLSTFDVNSLRQWLSKNPTKVIYQLSTPIYEPLNVAPIINLYKETTYISNNSIIPVNMKVTIDRVANRALEAIELSKENPTIENLSQARYWSNLMKESTLKDEFQNEISANTGIVDLSIEKKTASANIDIYIKMKNSLSLSLDTNNITFENFNASEDLEMREAVNLTVSSSLPYKINAYLEDEIYNADKTAMIDKSVLNIKNSSDTEYKVFNNILEPLLLLDNQIEGSNMGHSLDLILRGGNTHQADVYKTTIKFEVEQK